MSTPEPQIAALSPGEMRLQPSPVLDWPHAVPDEARAIGSRGGCYRGLVWALIFECLALACAGFLLFELRATHF